MHDKIDINPDPGLSEPVGLDDRTDRIISVYMAVLVAVTVLCVLGVGGWAVVELVNWVTSK